MPAVVSKRGVDDGNQKGGGFLQPAQESLIYCTIFFKDVQLKNKIFYFLDRIFNSQGLRFFLPLTRSLPV